jgi:hypothetical protein
LKTFTHALYTLATHPEAVGPLREEIEAIIGLSQCTSGPTLSR